MCVCVCVCVCVHAYFVLNVVYVCNSKLMYVLFCDVAQYIANVLLLDVPSANLFLTLSTSAQYTPKAGYN